MFDDVIPLSRTRFRMRSEDPSFHVAWRGGGKFLLSGEVSADPSTQLDIDVPGQALEVTLARRSKPEHAVSQLRRAMPRDVHVAARPATEGVEVTLTEVVLPAAKPPRLRVLSSDLSQRVVQLEENRVEFVGPVSGPCHLTVFCDQKRVTLPIPGGSSAQATAARVGASMPSGYRALVDGATVSVWKDADFFRAVA